MMRKRFGSIGCASKGLDSCYPAAELPHQLNTAGEGQRVGSSSVETAKAGRCCLAAELALQLYATGGAIAWAQAGGKLHKLGGAEFSYDTTASKF